MRISVADHKIFFDQDLQQYVIHVKQFLQRCKERPISISKEKWKFCCTEVTFMGFHLPQMSTSWMHQ